MAVHVERGTGCHEDPAGVRNPVTEETKAEGAFLDGRQSRIAVVAREREDAPAPLGQRSSTGARIDVPSDVQRSPIGDGEGVRRAGKRYLEGDRIREQGVVGDAPGESDVNAINRITL